MTNPSLCRALNEYITYGGDGWVQMVEFTPHGPNARVAGVWQFLTAPLPHVTDQLPFFDTKTLRPALRTLTAVTAATVNTETY